MSSEHRNEFLPAALGWCPGFDIGALEHNSPEFLTHLINAQNAAFADRNRYLADEDFQDLPWGELHRQYCATHTSQLACPLGCSWKSGACGARGLVSKEYGNQRRANLTRLAGTPTRGIPVPVPFGEFSSRYDKQKEEEIFKPGTTHLAISDKWGNVVSMTTTIEDNIGSGIVVPGRGFLLNNEMTDFSWESGTYSGSDYANRPEGGKRRRRTALGDDSQTTGGKRPRSSMTPTLVFDAEMQPVVALGSPGGSRIIGTVLNALVALLDSALPPLQALAAPRVISRNGETEMENSASCACPNGLDSNQELRAELEANGISLKVLNTTEPWTYVEMIAWNEQGKPVGYADPRISTGQAQQARIREPRRND